VRTDVDVAAEAAEAIRELCHSTITVNPAARVGDVYLVTAELSSLGHRLGQASTQLAQLLDRRLNNGALTSDNGGDPTAGIKAATEQLRLASAAARMVGEHMAAAQNAIAMIADEPNDS
jgi:hypothetical protein